MDSTIDHEERENFHEFLRAYCDIFAKNIYNATDYTYSNLKKLIRDDNLAIISGDKDSSVIVMDKKDYINKMETMINLGIEKGVYVEAEDSTLKDLKRFQDFLYRNFKKYEKYKKMCTTANQPAQLYGTAKTHKFHNNNQISLDELKFRPIIAQNGTCTYNAAQVIAEYLKPLYSDNEFIIANTQEFAKLIQQQQPLKSDEEYVSYDVESLFTNVPVMDTINYTLDQIYTEGKLTKICSRLVFKRLLLKLST